jgi:hypothetical protein
MRVPVPMSHLENCVDMHRATDNCMEDRGRNFGLFGSNRLKSTKQLPQDRFSDLERTELVNRLERLADVRPTVVARGKALVANPNYPGKEIVQEISHLLARHL